MNRDFVLWNLKEAKAELDRTIAEIESTSDYGHGEFFVSMGHLYHHLNTAWNARDVSVQRANECSEEDFFAWRQFPPEDEIYLGD